MSEIISLAQPFFERLNNAKKVLIGAHLNPDGDTLGSALAISHYLDSLGTPNTVLCHHNPPQNLRFLPGKNKVKQTTQDDDYDLGIVVDLGVLERLGKCREYFDNCTELMVIDHHIPQEKPGDFRIIDYTMPSTTTILTLLFDEANVTIEPNVATCLLTGIITDTGSFQYLNTNAESMELAAKLIRSGADHKLITEETYHNRPWEAIRLFGKAFDIMKTAGNNKIAWVPLSSEIFEETGALEEHSEGLANELLNIEGVEIAAVLREFNKGVIRISLRSMNDHNVAKVAEQFGGGGHKQAAGCTFRGPLVNAETELIGAAEECLALS